MMTFYANNAQNIVAIGKLMIFVYYYQHVLGIIGATKIKSCRTT